MGVHLDNFSWGDNYVYEGKSFADMIRENLNLEQIQEWELLNLSRKQLLSKLFEGKIQSAQEIADTLAETPITDFKLIKLTQSFSFSLRALFHYRNKKYKRSTQFIQQSIINSSELSACLPCLQCNIQEQKFNLIRIKMAMRNWEEALSSFLLLFKELITRKKAYHSELDYFFLVQKFVEFVNKAEADQSNCHDETYFLFLDDLNRTVLPTKIGFLQQWLNLRICLLTKNFSSFIAGFGEFQKSFFPLNLKELVELLVSEFDRLSSISRDSQLLLN